MIKHTILNIYTMKSISRNKRFICRLADTESLDDEIKVLKVDG